MSERRRSPAQQFEALQEVFGTWYQALAVFEDERLAQRTRLPHEEIEALTEEEVRALGRFLDMGQPALETYWKIHGAWDPDPGDRWKEPTEELEARATRLPVLLAALRALYLDNAFGTASPLSRGSTLGMVFIEVSEGYQRAIDLLREVLAEDEEAA